MIKSSLMGCAPELAGAQDAKASFLSWGQQQRACCCVSTNLGSVAAFAYVVAGTAGKVCSPTVQEEDRGLQAWAMYG